MARENFAAALAAVLKHEGGWADHPRDPGGATMKGVTLATYRQYRPGATKEQLRNITDAELQRIYRDGYWDVIRGDDLPAGVDFAVFDFAVNSGPARAARYLQAVVAVAQDGKIGPQTLNAVWAANSRDVINRLCDNRLSLLKGLSHWDAFGRGWSRRVSEVRALALSMVNAAQPVTPPRQPDDPGVASPDPSQPDKPGTNPIILLILFAAAIVAAFFVTSFFI